MSRFRNTLFHLHFKPFRRYKVEFVLWKLGWNERGMEMIGYAALPIFIQGSTEPICRDVGDRSLDCECGNTLIAGYQPRQYLGVGFECFSCKRVTLSESWPEGEPLRGSLLAMSPGRYVMSNSLDVSMRSGVASEHEILECVRLPPRVRQTMPH